MLYEANSYAHNSRHALWLDDVTMKAIIPSAFPLILWFCQFINGAAS